jgi:hypothetical protein
MKFKSSLFIVNSITPHFVDLMLGLEHDVELEGGFRVKLTRK